MQKFIALFLALALVSCNAAKKNSEASQNSQEKNTTNVPTQPPAGEQADDKEIRWMSFEEALAKQKEHPKKIFMDAYTKWCGPCKMLDRNTFHHPPLVKYVNEHYYAVKFDAESPEPITYKGKTYKNPGYKPNKRGRNSPHELTYHLGINAYPTMVFFDENGDVLTQVKGYQSPQSLELYLRLFAENKYKQITTQAQWEEYQKKFVPTF